MSLFKCKICGGSLEVSADSTVAECEYCGTQQTLPKLRDEKRTMLYERANHFRRNNEFDKAIGIYEQILNENNTDAEAYWSLVLCRFGIEYVEDPSSHKRIPTVNRTQLTSIFDDDNYRSALQYADDNQRHLYEAEAKIINGIQREILSISQKEEAFDVFICYKETDVNGRRTPDSVLAQDLYYQLTQEGFKVFFARITLEDKLGSAYEPYIFAALNSAKVMVVLGTKKEYFDAVWVRNEWSRYLASIKGGAKKVLIPAYRDMDPYDLPEEFSHLQAQDMSKLGFMQDLIRGIKKLTGTSESMHYARTSNNALEVSPNLTRVFIYLEDKDWGKAEAFCDKALLDDPNDPFAHLGKLMVEKQCSRRYELSYCSQPLDSSTHYRKILNSGNQTVITEVMEYNAVIRARNDRVAESIQTHRLSEDENARKEKIYLQAQDLLNDNDEKHILEAISLLKSIHPWKDSDKLIVKYGGQAIVAKNYASYVEKYPMIKEKKQIVEVRKSLINLLQNTKIGKKGFPNSILVLSIIAGLTLVTGFLVPSVVLGGIAIWLYWTQVYTKRVGIVAAILQYEEKIKELSTIPDFYTYAPQMAEFKPVVDAYIAEKENLVDKKAVVVWNSQRNEILQKREHEQAERIRCLTEEYQQKVAILEDKAKMTKAQYEREEQRLTKEKADKTSKYVTLGVFQISEKKAIKERLPEIDNRLSAIPGEKKTALSRIESEKSNAEQDLQKKKALIAREVEAKYPVPKSPESSFNDDMLHIANAEVEKLQKSEQEKMKDKEHKAFMKSIIKKYMGMNL